MASSSCLGISTLPKQASVEYKRKRKWRKIDPKEIGIALTLFPRPFLDEPPLKYNPSELEEALLEEAEVLYAVVEEHSYLDGLELNANCPTLRLRNKKKWSIPKLHKSIKDTHTKCFKHTDKKKLYINHRVWKRTTCPPLGNMDWSNCTALKTAREKVVDVADWKAKKRAVSGKKSTKEIKTMQKHQIVKENVPSSMDAHLADLLISLQHRELTPEDYELLLQLDDMFVAPKTVSSTQVNNLRCEEVSADSSALSSSCTICFDSYAVGNTLKYLPCGHFFHSSCIDNWLSSSSDRCPIDNLPFDELPQAANEKPAIPCIDESLQMRDFTPEDYDLLLQLDDAVSPVTVPRDHLESLPVEEVQDESQWGSIICTVCQEHYNKGQCVVTLPTCQHQFHQQCIFDWLLSSSIHCPCDGLPVISR